MERRPGCLEGLFKLAILTAAFDWLQDRFGFGRKTSCFSLGCGVILLFLFVVLVCGTCTGTEWTRLW
jgi:hypothetical protein